MAKPQRDNDAAARALVDAAFQGDATACDKHRITLRTLQRYRAALDTDPELSRLYAELSRRIATDHWAEELSPALRVGIRKMVQLIHKTSKPEHLPRVTEAVNVLSEIAMVRDLMVEDDGPPGSSPTPTDQPAALN